MKSKDFVNPFINVDNSSFSHGLASNLLEKKVQSKYKIGQSLRSLGGNEINFGDKKHFSKKSIGKISKEWNNKRNSSINMYSVDSRYKSKYNKNKKYKTQNNSV